MLPYDWLYICSTSCRAPARSAGLPPKRVTANDFDCYVHITRCLRIAGVGTGAGVVAQLALSVNNVAQVGTVAWLCVWAGGLCACQSVCACVLCRITHTPCCGRFGFGCFLRGTWPTPGHV